MSWYTVTKKVKGRAYRYRQRSYRVGGKVQTESVYLGPVDAGGAAVQRRDVTGGTPEASQDTEFITTTEQEDPALQILDLPGDRPDVSLRALEREHDAVINRMAAHELPLEDLQPVRVLVSDKLDRYRNRSGYFVSAPRSGQRNAFKQEYRRALADRWLSQVELYDPVLFNSMRCAMDRRHRQARAALTSMIFMSETPHKFRSYLWFMWSGRLPKDMRRKIKPQSIGLLDHGGGGWRDDAVKLTAEMIQHGSGKVFRKYDAVAKRARKRRDVERDIYRNMGFGDWLTGRVRKQRRRVEKAEVWAASCDTLRQKAGLMRHWFDHGTM